MKPSLSATMILVAIAAGPDVSADDRRDSRSDRWWERESKEHYWDGPCEVKIESRRGEFLREVKCKDGIGADWGGEFKREFTDGRCRVKQDAKRDEFKEEVKCRGR